MIKKFDKVSLEMVEKVLKEKLAEASKELGVKLDTGSISYRDYQFTTRLTGKVASEEAKEQNSHDLKLMLKMRRLNEDLADKQFKIGGTASNKVFRLVCYDGKKRNYPFIAEDQNGKSFKLGAEHLMIARIV